MLIKSRLFPYPILDQFEETNCYDDSSFTLSYDIEEDDKNNLIKLTISYNLDEENLLGLIKKGDCKTSVLIDCSYTNFRQQFDFGENNELVLTFPRDNFLESTEICGLIIANKPLAGFKSKKFKELYKGIEFDIEKNDILALYQAEPFHTEFEDEDIRKIESIFSIKRNEKIEEGFKVDFALNPKKIIIWVPSKTYDIYDSTKLYTDYTKNCYFSFFLTSTIATILQEIKLSDDFEDIQDVCFKYKWFKSIIKSYKTNTGNDLTLEIIKKEEPTYLAQILLGNCVVKGIESFNEILLASFNLTKE